FAVLSSGHDDETHEGDAGNRPGTSEPSASANSACRRRSSGATDLDAGRRKIVRGDSASSGMQPQLHHALETALPATRSGRTLCPTSGPKGAETYTETGGSNLVDDTETSVGWFDTLE